MMAPLTMADVNIEANQSTTLAHDSPSESPEVQENDILPTPPSETSIQSTSATNRMQKRRLQQYLKKIKRVVRDRSHAKKNDRLSTLDSFHEVFNIINAGDSTRKKVKQGAELCLDEKPLSPTESSWSSETDQNSNIIKNEPIEDAPITDISRSRPNFSETNSVCNRLLATVFLELPQGTITEILKNDEEEEHYQLCNILKRGDSFLEVLQGKGAQTMLLNAFCGHSKRRMYARIKCDKNIEPFELLCEFSPSGKSSTCTARIQILRLEPMVHPMNSLAQHRAIFTTRHNASCAVIYLDSVSIPFLGHFPSEITGRSILSLIHADDVNQIKQAHAQLHLNGGKIVSTPRLRMVSYNGTIVYTDSEWAAFINPWTQQIEMIVGRHTIRPNTQPTDSSETSFHTISPNAQGNGIENSVKPVATVSSYIDKIVETLVTGSNDQKETQHPTSDSPQSVVSLSINQINCLENVNRLLKSQSDAQNQLSRYISGSMYASKHQMPLTKEVLHQHNKKWEEECKYTWKNRLALKRSFDHTQKLMEPETKLPRTDAATARIHHTASPFSFNTIGTNLANVGLTNQNFSIYNQISQASKLIHPDQAIYATFWLDYLNAIQLQATSCNQIVR